MKPAADSILIRPCNGFDELSACVQLQIDVWGYGDRDVVPRRVFIVGQRIGGQVIGAFDVDRAGANAQGDAHNLVGFAMALPGYAEGRSYLHSHMLAVNPDYRNRGIGRRLKLLQREEALARGIRRMEWTFDPLEIKNSFLNLTRLGAIVRRYAPNFYGVTSSPLHGSVPTDRLYAEWWLDSERVSAVLGRKPAVLPTVAQEITVPHQIAHWRHSEVDQERVLDIQTRNREQFFHAFAQDLAVVGFRIDAEGNGTFLLGPWQELSRSLGVLQSE
jgi:predicted GNAT superfamily acetyltransferase